jgi:hypothetical protein
MKQVYVVCLGVLLAAVAPSAQKLNYGVTVTADRTADFGSFKSYAWDVAGRPALDKTVHQQIVDAIDRELKGLGLDKRSSGPADVLVEYDSNRRTDVDTSANAPPGKLPEYAVGVLVVVMRESASKKEVFRARAHEPIDLAPEKAKATIDGVVTEMFAKYPTRARR